MVDQRGFELALREFGNYRLHAALDQDLEVMHLVNALPSLDPFLLRQHLANYNIEVAACYFPVSRGDQESMHQYATAELSRLTRLLGAESSDAATSRIVSAMLSSDVAEDLAPLRQTLNLTGDDFRQGVFSWRGFLYYKWSMNGFWPQLIEALKEIHDLRPSGALTAEQAQHFRDLSRGVVEMARDNCKHISNALSNYDRSYTSLVAHQVPKTFRDFLMSAPSMFIDLGKKMGAISHIVGFWRSRFPAGKRTAVGSEELSIILQDFSSGFGERIRPVPSLIKRPMLLDCTANPS